MSVYSHQELIKDFHLYIVFNAFYFSSFVWIRAISQCKSDIKCFDLHFLYNEQVQLFSCAQLTTKILKRCPFRLSFKLFSFSKCFLSQFLFWEHSWHFSNLLLVRSSRIFPGFVQTFNCSANQRSQIIYSKAQKLFQLHSRQISLLSLSSSSYIYFDFG